MPPRPRLPVVFVFLPLLVSSLIALRADFTGADVFLNAAAQLSREWRYRDALQLYAQAERIASGPQRTRARVGVATMAVRLAEFDVAYAEAMEAMREQPEDPQVIDAFGQAAWANGLFDEAETAFRQAIAHNASDVVARIGLARVQAAHNRLDDALDNALAAIAAAPAEADAYYVAGAIYRRQRRLGEAIGELTKYYNLVPAFEVDRRTWTQGEIAFLRSFGRRVPGEIAARSLMMVHTIPFRLSNDKVIVEARVNGGDAIEFVVDTGAEQTVISAAAARRLGVAPISRTISAGVGEIGLRGLVTAQLESLQLGTLTVRNVPCLIKAPALEGLPVREGESFSPLALGLSTVIDYGRKQLVLARTLDAQPYTAEMPLWFSRLATVRGVVNENRPASFIVDSGGQVISIGLDTARALSPQPTGRRLPLQVFGTSGWDRDAFLMPNVSLAFNDVQLRKGSIVVMNLRAPSVLLGYRVGGTLGHKFLSDYRVTFDLQRSVLGLTSLR